MELEMKLGNSLILGGNNMGRQMFLHELFTSKIERNEKQLLELRILNWNIRNPSLKRAKGQADWIIKTNANVIILTEAKYSEGGRYIRDWLESFGFNVLFPKPDRNDYCVMVASKGLTSKNLDIKINFLPHRVVSITLETFLGKIKIVGIYVPSRGPIEKRNVDKRKFQNQMIDLLQHLSETTSTSNLIVGGDLNVVERNHFPYYPVFGEWEYEFYESFLKFGLADAYRALHPDTQEYSWFGKEGDGYRFDHFFVSKDLLQYVTECSYIHTPRTSKISDHSAMYLRLARKLSPST